MFVDLVGSTAMAERAEPETVRDVLSRYRDLSGQVISAHRGRVAQYVGDGIMAFFGFPSAREDDARRAVLAGLELLEGLDALDARIRREHGFELAARVGIHTGVVLVSDIMSHELVEHDAVIGAAPNQAARVQAVAPDGTVAISDDTYEIVRGYFDVVSLGTPRLKGIDRTVEVFRVIGPSGATDRLRAAGASRSPFVGRAEEVERVCGHWTALGAPGAPRSALVVVRGEAGIGKSRLTEELARTAREHSGAVMTAFAAPDRATSPWFPVVGLLERHLGLDGDDDDATAAAKITGACTALGIEAGDAAARLANLLGVSTPGLALPVQDPRIAREQTFGALVALVTAEAARRPTLLIVEDVQWADESTIELLVRLGSAHREVPLLLVATARPEFDPARLGTDVDVVTLGRLPNPAHHELIEALAEIHGVPPALWDDIAARSDGNPLFTEELAKAMGHARDPSAAAAAIPRTVRDLLTARLDELDRDKPLAQSAAVVGRDIDTDLLREVAGLTRRQVTIGLDGLEQAGIVERVPDAAVPFTHRFTHALLRDAAYESQEQSQRLAAHTRAADALRTRPGVDPGLVAQHFDAARRPDDAVTWYLIAGASAQTRAADAEAIRLLDRGLALVDAIAEDARDPQEFNLRIVRGTSHVNTKGYGAPEAAEDYGRALELSEPVGAVTDVVPATAAIWAYYLVHGELSRAGEAVVRLAAMRAPELEAEILCCEGVQRFFEGRIAESRALLEASVQRFDGRAADGESGRWHLPSDSAAVARTHLGCVLWLVGETAAARRQLDAATERARSLPDYPTGAFTQAYVSSYAAWVEILARRFEQGRALHAETTAIAERYGMLFWTAAGRSGDAIGGGHLGEPGAAIAALAETIELWRSLGAEAFLPFVVTQRAELRLLTDDPEEALADVDQALADASRTTEHFFTAEAHRLRAAILLARDPGATSAARAELATAVALAAEQGATVFELRAAADLVRLTDHDDADGRDDALAALRAALAKVPDGAELDDLDPARALVAG